MKSLIENLFYFQIHDSRDAKVHPTADAYNSSAHLVALNSNGRHLHQVNCQ